MKKRISIVVLAALASMALLVPIGSAHAATLRAERFCGYLDPGHGYQPVVLRPGQACTFLPAAVNSIFAQWEVVNGGSNGGGVCVAVVQSPPGWPSGRPLSPTGSGPGNWNCIAPYSAGIAWTANNGFNAVYGQAVLLNYSTVTIRTVLSKVGVGTIYYYA
jgi:hypothetical protein